MSGEALVGSFGCANKGPDTLRNTNKADAAVAHAKKVQRKILHDGNTNNKSEVGMYTVKLYPYKQTHVAHDSAGSGCNPKHDAANHKKDGKAPAKSPTAVNDRANGCKSYSNAAKD